MSVRTAFVRGEASAGSEAPQSVEQVASEGEAGTSASACSSIDDANLQAAKIASIMWI